jgi:hypothetical protein
MSRFKVGRTQPDAEVASVTIEIGLWNGEQYVAPFGTTQGLSTRVEERTRADDEWLKCWVLIERVTEECILAIVDDLVRSGTKPYLRRSRARNTLAFLPHQTESLALIGLDCTCNRNLAQL